MPAAKYIGNPAFRVHTQQGNLKRAIKGGMQAGNIDANYRIEADLGIAPHAAYVIQGTRVMLGRDVIWSTALAPAVQKELMKAAVRLLGKGLRAQAAIRFSQEPGKALRLTILAMENTATKMHDVAKLTSGVMGATLLGYVQHNIGLTDHTLQDLEALGHPYARRHGSIQIHE